MDIFSNHYDVAIFYFVAAIFWPCLFILYSILTLILSYRYGVKRKSFWRGILYFLLFCIVEFGVFFTLCGGVYLGFEKIVDGFFSSVIYSIFYALVAYLLYFLWKFFMASFFEKKEVEDIFSKFLLKIFYFCIFWSVITIFGAYIHDPIEDIFYQTGRQFGFQQYGLYLYVLIWGLYFISILFLVWYIFLRKTSKKLIK